MGRNWAITIGINQYYNLRPLRYARRDAEAVRDFCLSEAEFETVYCFAEDAPAIKADFGPPLRSAPTFGNLERFLHVRFEEPFLGVGDNLWFFFAGHGKRHQGRDYLMPIDGDPGNVERTAIPIRDISDRLRRSGADNVILMIDACRSEDDRDGGAGIGIEKQRGVVTLFSCSPSELAYEIGELQHGAFTYSLLAGLRIQGEGNCATVERLYQHLRYHVPALNRRYGKREQTPYAIAEPATKLHLILLPRQATLTDVMTLKNDAWEAESEGNVELAEHLWTRVLFVSPGDRQAIESIKRLARRPPAPPMPESVSVAPPPAAGRSAPATSPVRPASTPSPQPAAPPQRSSQRTPAPAARPSPPVKPPPAKPPPTVRRSRRRFLQIAAGAGGAVALGWAISRFSTNPSSIRKRVEPEESDSPEPEVDPVPEESVVPSIGEATATDCGYPLQSLSEQGSPSW